MLLWSINLNRGLYSTPSKTCGVGLKESYNKDMSKTNKTILIILNFVCLLLPFILQVFGYSLIIDFSYLVIYLCLVSFLTPIFLGSIYSKMYQFIFPKKMV